MVSKKIMNCGFNGHRVPVIPRAPRSIRRRGPHEKLVEDNEFCAFELLAAVAGKLLQESESSASSNVAEGKFQLGVCSNGTEKVDTKHDKSLKSESFDNGSCAESAFLPETSVEEHNYLLNFKGVPQKENRYVAEHTSAHEALDIHEKVNCDMKLENCEGKNSDGKASCKVGGSICIDNNFVRKLESGSEVQSLDEKNQIGCFSMANISIVNDPICECVNTNVLVNSDSSVKLPLYRDPISGALLRKHWNNVKLGIRDDDENSIGYNKFSTKIRPFRPQPCIERHRVRKMITYKYWKAAPKLKDCERHNANGGMKSFSHCRKSIYARDKCPQSPLKKRKLSDHRFARAYDQERSSDSISNISEKRMRRDKSSSAMMLNRASGTSASVKGHQKANTPHVKFSIKSLKVPELYIEVPETATVGSLKRTVMEAVTAILGVEMRVGVVFQGKNVRDDVGTLQQAGISQCSNLDNLGFTLEPSFTHVSPIPVTPKKLPILLPCDAERPLQRPPVTPKVDSGNSKASFDPQLVAKLDGVDNNEFISFPKTPDDALMDGALPNSKPLDSVPSMNVEAHALVPANPKPKRNELSQRRIRRPFSVLEVEALIEAVEKLGTGRWRDVKIRAFENADHRTYVDLKDKWKTLVHTASISPQQRRGEPVPHELLNRVLSAHSYWSNNLSKQH